MFSPQDIRALLVEDNPGDADLIRAYLEDHAQLRVHIDRAETVAEAVRALSADHPYQVVLLDLTLPDCEGLETLDRVRAADAGVPVILLTGLRDEQMAWAAVQRGAHDYVPKDGLTPDLLARSIRYTLDRTENERALRRSEEWFRSVVENVTDLVATVDASGRLQYTSPSQEEILGHDPVDLRGMSVLELVHPDERASAGEALRRVGENGGTARFQLQLRTAHGEWRVVSGDARNLLDEPAVRGIVLTARDITDSVVREALMGRQTTELRERMKEQRCLRRVLGVLHTASTETLDAAFEEVVAAIPAGFLDPDSTAARLTLDDRAWETDGFRDSEWELRTPVEAPAEGEPGGVLRVVRTALGPSETAPFIPEEESLIGAIAEAVGDTLLWAHTEAQLRRREAYFRSITEHSTDILAILDSDLTPRYLSPSGEEILGVELDPVGVGQSAYDFVHPDDLVPLRSLLTQLVETPREVRRSEVRVRLDGEWRTLEFAARNMLHDPDIDGIVVNARDITDRRRTEERYRTLFETMAQGVVYQDGGGRIISANPAAREILGLPREGLEGRASTDPEWRAIRPDGTPFPGEEHPAMVALRTGQEVNGVLMGIHNPAVDRTRWIRVDARPQFRTGADRPYQVYSTFADVTDQVEGEQALRRKDAILEAVSVASERFLTAGEIADVTDGVLDTLGRAAGVGKVDLWQVPDGEPGADERNGLRARWTAEEHRIPAGAAYAWPVPEGLGWLDELRDGRPVHRTCGQLSAAERASLDDPSLMALALIPVSVRDGLWGLLRFVDRDRETGWSDPELDALGAAGAILGAAIQRRQDAQQLRRRDQELLRAQKMEAVGRLAGGIAHDFNNLLTAIGGYASFVGEELPEGSRVAEEVREIHRAAERGGRLTKQLLAFSRQQVVEEKVLDPGRAVAEIEPLLTRLIGEHIRLETDVDDDRCPVHMDPTQLEQVLMNLALNSRDAIQGGGAIRISVDRVEADGDGPLMLPDTPPPGCYARIRVRDDGVGMDVDTLEHVFEPFFTTKEQGKGTGLGMATVYAIVQSVDGHIGLESAPGRGTTITILIPATERVPEPEPAEAESRATGRTGHGTILVVEDEAAVRRVAVRCLQRSGYTVLEAENGRAALDLVGAAESPVDVLLTDVVMPEIGGVDLARRLRDRFAGLRVLLTSGYTQDELVQQGLDEHELAFIPKPYTPADLAAKVAAVLGH